jgi:hypothetical protein
VYEELKVEDILECKNLITSTIMFLEARLFNQSCIGQKMFKKAAAKLITALTKLNPEAVWNQEDVLYLLRLVYASASSDKNEVVRIVVTTAKEEKSTCFLQELVKVLSSLSSAFFSSIMTQNVTFPFNELFNFANMA